MEIEKNHKYLHYKRLSLLTEQRNADGSPKPFRLLYSAMNGDIITPDDGEVVVTSVNRLKANRTVQFVESRQVRTLADCLFCSVFLKNYNGTYTEYHIQAN